MMNMKIFEKLNQVRRPGRYIGKEHNIIKKKWTEEKLKILVSYPDLYEIGMSNQAVSILYKLFNSQDEILCERCFAPAEDMEKFLIEKEVSLYSLENKKPVKEFDLLGFTLQHELNYTNILTILELGDLKIWQKDREGTHPLIMGGGPCTLNPEPIAKFFDFFIIGDSEKISFRVIEKIKKWKKGEFTRNKLLETISQIESVYVPSLYKLKETKEGFRVPVIEGKITRATLSILKRENYSIKPVVPYIQTVHDRINVEIMRGCPKSCNFCQARIYYGPPRIRKIEEIVSYIKECYRNTGHEEVSLSSLSTGSYSGIKKLIEKIKEEFEDQYVFINLPSLWVGEDTINILKEFLDTKRPGLTFAPEATSRKMKKIINKFVHEEELKKVIKFAFNHGWKKVKLYYMLGLPGLKKPELKVMEEFIKNLRGLDTQRKVKLNLSFSTFVPKPHTPLQWENFVFREEFNKQFGFVKKNLSNPGIKWNIRDYEYSLLEAVMARGDRKLSEVIHKAWEKGARFDSWERKFNFSLWKEAFEDLNIKYKKYLFPNWSRKSILPWDHIKVGSEHKLWESYEEVQKIKNRYKEEE